METYLTAVEYARKHNCSKQWIIKLARAGRLDGAYLAGAAYLIPEDAPIPPRLKPGPKALPDSAAAFQARRRVLVREGNQIAQEAHKATRQVMSDGEREAAVLAAMGPRQKHIHECEREGWDRQPGHGCWWIDGQQPVMAYWSDDLTFEQWQQRNAELNAYLDGGPDPVWMKLNPGNM